MDYENKTINWKPLSEYNGGRVLATNGLGLLIGEITSDGDCADGDGCLLCGITGFADIDDVIPKPKESEDEQHRKWILEYLYDGLRKSDEQFKDQFKAAIAWFEKQGKLVDEYEDRLDRCACENFNKGYKAATEHLKERQTENPIFNVPPREVILAIWDLGNEWKELTDYDISTEHGTQLDYIQKHWKESEYYHRVKQGEKKPDNIKRTHC